MLAWLFDIDGVLTNPKEKHTVNPQTIPLLVAKLQKGEPVGLISGRPIAWQIDKIVTVIEASVAEQGLDPLIIDNLFVSGEFGNACAMHVEGKRTEIIYREHAISPELIKRLMDAVVPFAEYVYFDWRKQTQFTLAAKETTDMPTFLRKKPEIIATLQYIVGKSSDIEVHDDRIAINVKKKAANKRFATDQFINWLAQKKSTPQKFYAFGDSVSDLEIGKELHKNNLLFEFVFVGEKELVEQKILPFTVIFTKNQYDLGTLEFLQERSV